VEPLLRIAAWFEGRGADHARRGQTLAAGLRAHASLAPGR
jgi:hypothetical protein